MINYNSTSFNHLLPTLSKSELEQIEPYLEEVSLTAGVVLHEAYDPIKCVYFPLTAMISLVSIMENGATTEIGLIGNEGMVGLPVFLGGEYSINRAIVQVSGKSLTMRADILISEFQKGGQFQKILLLHTQARLTQIAQSAACNRQHKIEARFACTQSVVKTEVDQFLKSYSSDHLYQQALSFPYFRNKLIVKVLNNIPNNHLLIDEFDYFIDDVSFCISSLDEKVLIINKIKEQIPYIIEKFNQFNYTYNSDNNSQHKFIEKSNSNTKKLSWWIRVDTTKPPMTYYFGLFDNLFDAKDNCGGYLEDLVAEKAEGIYFEFQYVNPPSLMIENYPEYLRLENQRILANISQLSLQKEYYENLFICSYDSCLIIDENAIIQEVNNSMIKLLKTPKEKLINQSLNLFIHPEYLLKFSEFIHQLKDETIDKKKQSCFSTKLLLSDKSSIIININVVNIQNHRQDLRKQKRK